MTYTPETWTDETGVGDGTPVSADRMNHIELGIEEAHDLADAGGGLSAIFRAYRNTPGNVTTGQVVVFDAESFDTQGWYNPATGRFTPQVAGYYRLSTTVMSNSTLTADNYYIARIRKNGADVATGPPTFQRGSATTPASSATDVVFANGTTDYFDVGVYHNQGVAFPLAGASVYTYFAGELIAPTGPGVPSPWIRVGGTGGVPFENGWTHMGGVYGWAEYRLVGDEMQLRGAIKNGTAVLPAFTLPVAPAFYRAFTARVADGSLSLIDVTNTGAVVPAKTSTFMPLDQIRFSTAAATAS